MGQSLYPRVLDLLSPRTQSLTDNEIHYIIENQVQRAGMPEWRSLRGCCSEIAGQQRSHDQQATKAARPPLHFRVAWHERLRPRSSSECQSFRYAAAVLLSLISFFTVFASYRRERMRLWRRQSTKKTLATRINTGYNHASNSSCCTC